MCFKNHRVTKFFMVLVLSFSLFAFAGCGLDSALDGLEERIEGLVEGIFYPYEEFGLIFDPETGNLYYDGEQVAFFEDRRGTMNRVMSGDRDASGLHIQAERDGSGNLTGLELTRR